MAAVEVIRVRKAIQYTGSNGSEVAAFAAAAIVSDNGTHLELGDPVTGWVAITVHLGDWYEITDGTAWTNAMFADRHVTKTAALADTNTVYDPTALTNRVTAAEGSIAGLMTSTAGKLSKVDLVSISVPLLLLLGTADRPIVWNRPFSDANYQLSYAFDASTIGRITCAPVVGTKTASGITIRVTASLLAVSVLGVVHVMGIGA